METLRSDKTVVLQGGNLPVNYKTEKFLLEIQMDGSEEDINTWIYAERKIAFQRIRSLMTQSEIESMIGKSPKNAEGIPIVTILATECGKKVRTPEMIIDEAISALRGLPEELKKEALEKLGIV